MNRETIEELMHGYLDGELTHQDRQKFEVMMDQDPKLKQEYLELRTIQEGIGQLKMRPAPEEEVQAVMNDLGSKTVGGFGWILFIFGLTLSVGYGVYEFPVDPTVTALEKTMAFSMGIGILLLFVGVLRQRLIARKTDKYKEVKL